MTVKTGLDGKFAELKIEASQSTLNAASPCPRNIILSGILKLRFAHIFDKSFFALHSTFDLDCFLDYVSDLELCLNR